MGPKAVGASRTGAVPLTASQSSRTASDWSIEQGPVPLRDRAPPATALPQPIVAPSWGEIAYANPALADAEFGRRHAMNVLLWVLRYSPRSCMERRAS